MSPEERIVLVIVILTIALIAVVVELKYIRGRSIAKKFASARVGRDQAFNSLHTTRAVKNRLRAEGYSTEKVDLMLMRADSAFGSRDYDTCIDICERAREELYKCRQGGPAPIVEEEAQTTTSEVSSDDEDIGGLKEPDEIGRPPEAGLHLQSKFELKAALGDLERYDGTPEIRERASEMLAEAERLQESGDYQRSLSTSFRARKLLAGELEGDGAEVLPSEAPAAKGPEQKGAPARCSHCREPIIPGDRFCGHCGEAVAERRCRSCDTPLLGEDRFCRKCGTEG